jgi:hypothetical protein
MNGFEATVWRVETAGRVLAVRLMRRGVPAREEVEALRLAARHHQPVPRIVATGAIAGCDFIVMSWCDGVTIGDLLVTGGDPEGLGKLLGAAQADLHRPIDESGSALCHLDFQPFNVRVAMERSPASSTGRMLESAIAGTTSLGLRWLSSSLQRSFLTWPPMFTQ